MRYTYFSSHRKVQMLESVVVMVASSVVHGGLNKI